MPISASSRALQPSLSPVHVGPQSQVVCHMATMAPDLLAAQHLSILSRARGTVRSPEQGSGGSHNLKFKNAVKLDWEPLKPRKNHPLRYFMGPRLCKNDGTAVPIPVP
jgi:hypothetical protein